MRKLRIVFVSLGLAAFVFTPALPVHAGTDVFEGACDDPDAQSSSVCDARNAGPDDDPVTGDEGIIARIVNVVAVVGGILAVLLIMWGGFKYITSAGDAQGVNSARQTIIYAVVGLVVIVLAQAIISFIIDRL